MCTDLMVLEVVLVVLEVVLQLLPLQITSTTAFKDTSPMLELWTASTRNLGEPQVPD